VTIKGQKPEKLALAARMPFYRVPGVGIAVLDRHELEWAKAYGVRDAQTLEPVTTETLFQAGALGQPLAAAAALILVARGRLDLDEDINERLVNWKIPANEFTRQAPVTLRGLLTHTAGFPESPLPGYPRDARPPTLLALLQGRVPDHYVRAEPDAVPGQGRARPSEAGFAVLQQLLEDVSGTAFAALIRELVLEPLGTGRSAFESAPPEGPPGPAASGHERHGRPFVGGSLAYPASAAAGLWTTPTELVSFLTDIMRAAMERGEGILPPAAARTMLAPQAGGRSFGFAVEGAGQDVRFHLRGRTGGFACTLDVYPYRGQGAVIMTNSDNGLLLADEILRALAAAYLWPDFGPVEKALYRLDPSIYAGYVGRYEVTPEYALDITHEDYYLVIRPTGQAPTKFYVESQTFFFSIDPYIRIQFHTDEKGDVAGLTLWQQDFKQEARKVG
jgi:CubicO group peptidase (beta-lactamase class C family)